MKALGTSIGVTTFSIYFRSIKKVSLDKIQVSLIRKLRLYCGEQMQLKEKWHVKRAEAAWDTVHMHISKKASQCMCMKLE